MTSRSLTLTFVCGLFLAGSVEPARAALDPKKNPLVQIDLNSYIANLPEDLILEKMDSEGKGTTDMWVVFKKGENNQKLLVRQLFDFNHDGKIDVANHYQKGKKVRSELDLDYDGKVDAISEFDPETGEITKKTQIENSNLTWRYWYKAELRRKEVDRNADGDPDMWVHYRSGKVVKTEVDVAFDGKNIRLEGDLTKNRGN